MAGLLLVLEEPSSDEREGGGDAKDLEVVAIRRVEGSAIAVGQLIGEPDVNLSVPVGQDVAGCVGELAEDVRRPVIAEADDREALPDGGLRVHLLWEAVDEDQRRRRGVPFGWTGDRLGVERQGGGARGERRGGSRRRARFGAAPLPAA